MTEPTRDGPHRVTTSFPDEETSHFISLGAGVQSTVLYLMAVHGAIQPAPTAAIFADTGWEPTRVYDHLAWLQALPESQNVPIHVVSAGNLYDAIWSGRRAAGSGKTPFTDIPSFVRNTDGTLGMKPRQCTNKYKITPIVKAVRDLAGRRRNQRRTAGPYAVQWIGISLDEWHRSKPSAEEWIENRFPLIDMGMRRHDCARWFAERYPSQPLAKSSCVGCPYHSDRQWLDLYRGEPEQMARAIALDDRLREDERINMERKGRPQYLHKSGRPLGDVLKDLDRMDSAQLRLIDDQDQFGNECEGYCAI